MKVYLDAAVAMNFLVDFLLLLGANGLAGYPASVKRCALGALVGGIYGGAWLLPGFAFLGSGIWRGIALGIMGGAAFGLGRSGLLRTGLFALLSLALGGGAVILAGGGPGAVVLGAAVPALGSLTALRGRVGRQKLVKVELRHRGKRVELLALRDTGNTLTDPVTGASVVVADAQSAGALLGLSRQQLADPVTTVASGVIPGLRLVPYRAVGVAGGMLVALRLDGVRIGKRGGPGLVAFAPAGLGENGEFRALTGGWV